MEAVKQPENPDSAASVSGELTLFLRPGGLFSIDHFYALGMDAGETGSELTMAKQRQSDTVGLDGIATAVRTSSQAAGEGRHPPVELWNPPFCGNLDIRIATDGTWFYLGSPIGRLPLVRLFASVLKREGDDYFLVTPVEKVGITVEDAPFLAVELKIENRPEGRQLNFRTNVDDWVPCNRDHALRFELEPSSEGLKPYLHVRRNLWAKVTRALFYDLVEIGEEREIDGIRMFGLESGGAFFPMARADVLEGLT